VKRHLSASLVSVVTAVGLTVAPGLTPSASAAAQTFSCRNTDAGKIRVCIDYDFFDDGHGWAFFGFAFSTNNATVKGVTLAVNDDAGTSSTSGTISPNHQLQTFLKSAKNGRACAGIHIPGSGEFPIGGACIND
jgi:hypothetical protein